MIDPMRKIVWTKMLIVSNIIAAMMVAILKRNVMRTVLENDITSPRNPTHHTYSFTPTALGGVVNVRDAITDLEWVNRPPIAPV